MSDYVKQLENRIDELQQKVSRCEPAWATYRRSDYDTAHFLFFNRCLLAQCHKDPVTHYVTWTACVYNTLGSIDKTESKNNMKSLEEAKEWVTQIVYSKRDFGEAL